MMSKRSDGPSNTEKDPDDWVSGDEPMTGAQASYLKRWPNRHIWMTSRRET